MEKSIFDTIGHVSLSGLRSFLADVFLEHHVQAFLDFFQFMS